MVALSTPNKRIKDSPKEDTISRARRCSTRPNSTNKPRPQDPTVVAVAVAVASQLYLPPSAVAVSLKRDAKPVPIASCAAKAADRHPPRLPPVMISTRQ